jgi:hypothetical protein
VLKIYGDEINILYLESETHTMKRNSYIHASFPAKKLRVLKLSNKVIEKWV